MKDIIAQSPKTIEEHRDYLYGIVKLKLFFVHRFLAVHPDENFSNVIRNRVDIYRKTDANPEALNPTTLHFDENPWLEMENAAFDIYKKNIENASTFEESAFEIFKPSLDARCERDWLDKSGLAGYQCGSIRYELKANDDKSVGFHIANAVAPHSIFDDKNYLAKCLLDMCDAVEKQFDAKSIQTFTWLNSNKKWLEYFPAEWQNNLGEPNKNIQWHYGFWGQFISSRGTLNEKAANHLRQTNEMMFYPRLSSCTIESIRKHLELRMK